MPFVCIRDPPRASTGPPPAQHRPGSIGRVRAMTCARRWHNPCNPLVGNAGNRRPTDIATTLGVTMWRRSIPISSLAAYAAEPEAFRGAAATPGRGPARAIALAVLGLVLAAAALALSGRLPLSGLPEGPLRALLSLVGRS